MSVRRVLRLPADAAKGRTFIPGKRWNDDLHESVAKGWRSVTINAVWNRRWHAILMPAVRQTGLALHRVKRFLEIFQNKHVMATVGELFRQITHCFH